MSKLEDKFDNEMVVDDDGMWSQVCEDCVQELDIKQSILSINALNGSVCGARGCENEADYYIDFK